MHLHTTFHDYEIRFNGHYKSSNMTWVSIRIKEKDEFHGLDISFFSPDPKLVDFLYSLNEPEVDEVRKPAAPPPALAVVPKQPQPGFEGQEL